MPSLKHSLAMLHPAANRHPKATHQWLLMGVQACRLPALKSLKPLNRLKPLKRLMGFQACRLPALKCHRLNNPLACFILQPTGTPRLHIHRFLCVQACRLPAPKRHRLNIPLACFILQPTGTTGHTSMASYWCPSLPFASP